MRATARGDLLLALAAALALASLPLRSLAPALAALALLGLVAASRQGLAEARVAVRIEAPGLAGTARPFLVAARAGVDPPLPCSLTLAVPDGAALRALDAPRGLGEGRWEAAIQAQEPGALAFRGARATLADPLGLWARDVADPAEARVRVLPEAAFALRGGQLGPLERMARGRRAFQETLEVERVRPYQPGDRFRDVDWAHSSKLQRLVTRERSREAPRPLIAVVDATHAMRWRRGTPMTATASRVAMALAGAARAGGVPVGAVVYGDRGVLHLARAARARSSAEQLARILADLPEAVPLASPPAVRGSEAPLGPAERRFLAQLAPFVQGPLPAAAPLDAALAAVATASGQPSLVALVTSVDLAPRAAVVGAQRLMRRGHLVVVVSPHLPAHVGAEGPRDAALAAWAQRNRAWAAQRLARLGAPLVVVRPGEEMARAGEVVAWAS